MKLFWVNLLKTMRGIYLCLGAEYTACEYKYWHEWNGFLASIQNCHQFENLQGLDKLGVDKKKFCIWCFY